MFEINEAGWCIVKYTVSVSEINYGTIKVEAISEEDALLKAETEYTMGNIIWNQGEHKLFNAKCMPKRKRILRCFEKLVGKRING